MSKQARMSRKNAETRRRVTAIPEIEPDEPGFEPDEPDYPDPEPSPKPKPDARPAAAKPAAASSKPKPDAKPAAAKPAAASPKPEPELKKLRYVPAQMFEFWDPGAQMWRGPIAHLSAAKQAGGGADSNWRIVWCWIEPDTHDFVGYMSSGDILRYCPK